MAKTSPSIVQLSHTFINPLSFATGSKYFVATIYGTTTEARENPETRKMITRVVSAQPAK